MIYYKNNVPTERTELLLTIYDSFENSEETETEKSGQLVNNEFNEFREDILIESLEVLLNNSTDFSAINTALRRIAHFTALSYEDVFSQLSSSILQIILELSIQQETCSNSLYALCLFTYFTDDFNEIIIESNLFEFLAETIHCFDETEFNRCIILLINLFITIPLDKPLEVGLIQSLLDIEICKIVQVPKTVNLYSILIEKEGLPVEFIQGHFRIFRNILSQPLKPEIASEKNSITFKIIETQKKVFKTLDMLLSNGNEAIVKNTMNFINNNLILMHLVQKMNESNAIYCFSIIKKMMLKDDTFFPQLTAYEFDKKIICFCNCENENIQCNAILFSVDYIKNIPGFSLKFIDFEFENIFLKSSFKIKIALNELYINVLPNIIKYISDFSLSLSQQFLNVFLDLIDNENVFVKMSVYKMLILFFKYQANFVFDFDIIEEYDSHDVAEIAENDCLSNNDDLSKRAKKFLIRFVEFQSQNSPEDQES